MAGSQPLTDYERRRQANIKRNQEMLFSFNIQPVANDLFASSKPDRPEPKPKEKKPKLESQDQAEIRRSLRPRVNLSESQPAHKHLDPIASMIKANWTNLENQQNLIDGIKGLSKAKRSSFKRNCCDSVVDLKSLVLKPQNIVKLMPTNILSLVFFPCVDRSIIVGGNSRGCVAFWDVDRYRKYGEAEGEGDGDDDDGVYVYAPHTGPVSGIAISPFSLTKVYTSSCDGCIRLMDVEKESFNLVYSNENPLSCLSLRPHETKSLYFGEGNGVINAWDERAGKNSSSWELHDEKINTVDFHPENTHLMATSSTDGTACIWDLRNINANQPKTLKMVDHRKAVHSAYFSPTGSFLATTSANNKVGLLRGVDFQDISVVKHENPSSVTPFRGTWGWDDSYLFIGSLKKGVDVIPTNYRRMVTLESPHVSVHQCRLAAHPHKVGMLAGASSITVSIWVSE